MSDREEFSRVSVKDVALLLAHQADEMFGQSDPRQPFVALMTAAAVAGHIIQRTP